ncbi:MAG: ribonuclease protein component [Bacteroidota bacterium]
MAQTFGKSEKLTQKAAFDALYTSGKSLKVFPFVLRYGEHECPEGVDRQVAVLVPKRNVKLAVNRNRIKRQMRELYRLNKDKIENTGRTEAWTIRYLGNRLNEYAFLEAQYLKLIDLYNKALNEEDKEV